MSDSLKSLLELGRRNPIHVAALSVLLLTTFWMDLATLTQYPIAVGVDGYYYVLQVDHLWTTGNLYFATPTPLVLYYLAALKFLIPDTVLAIKIGACLLHALLAIGIFLLAKELTRSFWLGFISALIVAITRSRFYFEAEFLNNLGSIVLLVWCGWSLCRLVASRRRKWLYLSLALFGASVVSHRSAVIVAVVFAVLLLLLRKAITGTQNQKIVAIVIMSLVWLTPAILANRSLILEFIHSTNELRRWPAWPIAGALFADELLLFVTATAMLIVLGLLARKSKLTASHYVFGCIALYSLLITLNPFFNPETGLTGLAGRVRVLSYIQSAVMVSGLVLTAYSLLPALPAYLAATLLPLIAFCIVSPLPLGLSTGYLARRVRLIEGLQLHAPELGAATFVVASHGDQFVVRNFTGISSAQRPPETNVFPAVYWLINESSEESTLVPASVLIAKTGGGRISLIEDASLSARLKSISQFERLQLFNVNPHLRRTFESRAVRLSSESARK